MAGCISYCVLHRLATLLAEEILHYTQKIAKLTEQQSKLPAELKALTLTQITPKRSLGRDEFTLHQCCTERCRRVA